MRKKIIITLLIMIILIQTIIPIKTMAFTETSEIVSVPAQLNNYKSDAVEENEMTGLDLVAGILIEPTVEFFTFVLDSIMSVFSGFMNQEEIQFVMVSNEDKDTLPDLGEGTPFTIDEEEIEGYKTATGKLNHLEYPRFTYTPEEIFAGKIDLLDINFIDKSNEDDNWLKIRTVVAQWYQILRMAAIIGLLSVLIYTGIKIIISSNTKDKAKYKEMIVNWFVAVILAFSMHYIMAFILAVMEEVLGLLNEFTGVIEVVGVEGGINFKTNLMGLARFQMQQQHFSAKIGHLVIYTALVVYTFKFTFVYLKRVLRVAFLTVIAPIVAITYPIDKMDGEAKGFQLWLKDYIFNALLQPVHYLLYYILVSSSLSLAAHNPIYGIAALMFISQAERLLKTIFGFEKAKGGTVGGIAGAFATGAVTSSLMKYVRDPMHPFKGGKSGGGSSGGSRLSDGTYSDDTGISFLEDTTDEDLLPLLGIYDDNPQNPGGGGDPSNTGGSGAPVENPIIPDLAKFFERYRQGLPVSVSELGGLSYDSDGSGSFEDILQMMAAFKRTGVNPGTIPGLEGLSYEELQNVLRARVAGNEMDFLDNNMLPQYVDGDSRTSSDLLEEIMRLNALATDPRIPSNERRAYIRQSEKLLKKLKRRMAQNEYIQRSGGALALRQQEEARINNLKNTSQSQDGTNSLNPGTGLPQNEQPKTETEQNPEQEQQPGQRPESQQGQQPEQGPESGSKKKPSIAEKYVRKNNNKPIQPLTPKQQEKDEQKLRREESWEKFKKKQKMVLNGVTNVGKNTGKTIIKPVWDVEKGLDWKYNGKRLAGNIIKGTAGVTLGVAAAAVQAGISITDGKYNAMEGIATVGAGMVGASHLAQTSEQLRESRKKDQQSLEKYREQWFNRDDIISSYNMEYPGEGKAMRRRAVNNYVTRGITDFKDQKQAMKYADKLKKERGLHEEEADKVAIATLQYKKNLTRHNSYMVLFDEKRREKYLNARVDAYSGAASKDSIRRLHDELIENVRDFDRVNG